MDTVSEQSFVNALNKIRELSKENKTLKERIKALEQNTSRSVLRRLDVQLEKPNRAKGE